MECLVLDGNYKLCRSHCSVANAECIKIWDTLDVLTGNFLALSPCLDSFVQHVSMAKIFFFFPCRLQQHPSEGQHCVQNAQGDSG
jgi:hypothetical protein